MSEIEMDIHSEGQMKLLKKAQEFNRILLREIDRVCSKYGLKYYLICGALLGAVRHKSFIPWDDDIDIAMTRHDFDILKKYASSEWDGKEFLFVDYSELGKGVFLDFLSRVVYMKEEVSVITYQKIHGKGRSDIENHIPLDIYVLDHASDNEKKHKLHTMLLQGIYGLCMGHRAFVNFDEYKDQPPSRRRLIHLLVSMGRLVPAKVLFAFYEAVRKKYNKNMDTDSYIISNGFIFCLPLRFKKAWFGDGVRVLIDDEEFLGPKDWDSYLCVQYGDYMKLPPLKYRHPAHTYGADGIFHTIKYAQEDETSI